MALPSLKTVSPIAARMSFLGTGLLVALGSSCGAISPKTVKSSEYRYHFSECGADVRQFGSKKDYCDALRDESLNHGCAEGPRRHQYEIDCI